MYHNLVSHSADCINMFSKSIKRKFFPTKKSFLFSEICTDNIISILLFSNLKDLHNLYYTSKLLRYLIVINKYIHNNIYRLSVTKYGIILPWYVLLMKPLRKNIIGLSTKLIQNIENKSIDIFKKSIMASQDMSYFLYEKNNIRVSIVQKKKCGIDIDKIVNNYDIYVIFMIDDIIYHFEYDNNMNYYSQYILFNDGKKYIYTIKTFYNLKKCKKIKKIII